MPDLIAVGCKCDDAVVSARAACLLDELDSVIEGIGLCSPCIALDTDEPVLGKQDHFHGRTLAGIRGCTKRSLNLICLHERHYGTALCSFYGKDDLLAGKGLVRRIALFCWNQRIPLYRKPDVVLCLPVGPGFQFLQLALPASRGQHRSICAGCKASIRVLCATRRLISTRTTSGPPARPRAAAPWW